MADRTAARPCRCDSKQGVIVRIETDGPIVRDGGAERFECAGHLCRRQLNTRICRKRPYALRLDGQANPLLFREWRRNIRLEHAVLKCRLNFQLHLRALHCRIIPHYRADPESTSPLSTPAVP